MSILENFRKNVKNKGTFVVLQPYLAKGFENAGDTEVVVGAVVEVRVLWHEGGCALDGACGAVGKDHAVEVEHRAVGFDEAGLQGGVCGNGVGFVLLEDLCLVVHAAFANGEHPLYEGVVGFEEVVVCDGVLEKRCLTKYRSIIAPPGRGRN